MTQSPARKPWWRRWFGTRSERAAARFLRRLGCRILARNYACPHGELDLVAEQAGCIVFVEVRSTGGDDPERPGPVGGRREAAPVDAAGAPLSPATPAARTIRPASTCLRDVAGRIAGSRASTITRTRSRRWGGGRCIREGRRTCAFMSSLASALAARATNHTASDLHPATAPSRVSQRLSRGRMAYLQCCRCPRPSDAKPYEIAWIESGCSRASWNAVLKWS